MQFVERSIGPVLALYVESVGVSHARVAAVAGGLFSVIAVSAAIGHYACGRLLRQHAGGRVLIGASLTAAAGAALFALARNGAIMAPAAALFGVGGGMAMTAIYSTAGSLIPRGAQGAGFGLLTSASLIGLAISPIIAGLLAARTLRGIFVLDLAILLLLTVMVKATMKTGEIR
jgi:DHA1 family multidrug resistance protein-like MFS transporter